MWRFLVTRYRRSPLPQLHYTLETLTSRYIM
jgi:hypothetical protein